MDIPTPQDPPLTPDERNAMRAYLQRCEVRISTQHRIATAFIGGAGLLVLIPIFLRDIVDGILAFLVAQIANIYPALSSPLGELVSLMFFVCIGYVFILSLAIPLVGVYWLLEDLVHFYFTLYTPGFSDKLLNPTLGIGGINFSPDESPRVKQAVMKLQYDKANMGFMIPFSQERREEYFETLIADTGGLISPPNRDIEGLKVAGIITGDAESIRNAQHFNAAMGIARGIDRQLSEEVALSEMHLTRNTLYLRRLMLRYVKTLLMFLWTTVISFLMLPLLHDERVPNLPVLAFGFLVWAALVEWIIRRPVRWIYRHRVEDPEPRHIDPQLTKLETRVKPFLQVGRILAVIATILGLFQG
jgi:hypothetical protein